MEDTEPTPQATPPTLESAQIYVLEAILRRNPHQYFLVSGMENTFLMDVFRNATTFIIKSNVSKY